jgi:periplasmic copper chaperone A
MKGLIAAALFAAALGGCGEVGDAEVEDAWVRLPAAPGRPGAAYFHLRTGAKPVTIVKVETPAAVRTELHESMASHHGGMTMTPLAQVALQPGESVTFKPGGKHVMLYDVNPQLKAGTKVPLVIHDAGSEPFRVDALVVAPGDPAPKAEGRP